MTKELQPLKTFYQKVDTRSRKAMEDFLRGHFRYDTGNSWNRSTSYANRVKVWDVIPAELRDKVFDMMDVDGFYDDLNFIIEEWGEENDYAFQAGFNGRSGGYLVMYQGYYTTEYFIKPDATFNHPSGEYSQKLRRWVQKEEAERNGFIGKTYKSVHTYPMRDIDQDEDFTDWSLSQLRERVKLVQSFDKMCDAVVRATIQQALENEVVEEEILVPKKIKTIQPKEE